MCTFSDVISISASLATIIGGISVPIAIIVFKYQKKKDEENEKLEQKEREMQSFNSLSTEWRDYLKIFIENPEIDIPGSMDSTKKSRQTLDKKAETANEILISMFESAFFHYTYYSGDKESSPWQTWDRFLEQCLKDDKLFNKQCDDVVKNNYYSEKFCEHLKKRLDKIKKDT